MNRSRSWVGNTDEMLDRIRPSPIHRAIITAAILLSAAIVIGEWFTRPSPDRFHATPHNGGMMVLDAATGMVGFCAPDGDRVHCTKRDHHSGPLEAF